MNIVNVKGGEFGYYKLDADQFDKKKQKLATAAEVKAADKKNAAFYKKKK